MRRRNYWSRQMQRQTRQMKSDLLIHLVTCNSMLTKKTLILLEELIYTAVTNGLYLHSEEHNCMDTRGQWTVRTQLICNPARDICLLSEEAIFTEGTSAV